MNKKTGVFRKWLNVAMLSALGGLAACGGGGGGSSDGQNPPAPSSAPAAPAGVTAATTSGGNTNLSWSSVSGADSYNIYRAVAPNVQTVAANKIGTSIAPAYSDSGLSLATRYYYKVTAQNSLGEGSASDEIWARAGLLAGAQQGTPLGLTKTVSTVAGSPWGTDGSATTATFLSPLGVASDGTNLYVADSSAHTIRKIAIASGDVTTLAGSGTPGAADGIGAAASFNTPKGIATDGVNVYVADRFNYTIRKIVIATGAVSTLAGSAGLTAAVDGIGAAARFSGPNGITTDNSSLYVTDGHQIRAVDIATGAVTTLAGAGAGSADGTGAAASFYVPAGIMHTAGNLYVADTGNHKIRRIVIASKVVTTLAGSGLLGGADGTGTAASFYSPQGIASDGTSLYVSDSGNTIRRVVIASGAVTTLAGLAGRLGEVDATGSAARFRTPIGIVSAGGYLYVADNGNRSIRKIAASTAATTTFAGGKRSVDGTGAAARFVYPWGVATDGDNLYLTDNHFIRKLVIATGEVSTLAGTGQIGAADGLGAAASFRYPAGITTDGRNLYVADEQNHAIRKINIATGEVSTLAGVLGVIGSADGVGTAAQFSFPQALATDGQFLYVADSGNQTIRKIVLATGAVTTLAGAAGVSGAVDGIGAAASFANPGGITISGGKLYVSNSGSHTIRVIDIATAAVTTLAGMTNVQGSADGAGTLATFNSPQQLTSDGTSLYVADTLNGTIRKIDIATAAVSTLVGSAGMTGAADGLIASFNTPTGITTDGVSLYVTDSANATVRNIQ